MQALVDKKKMDQTKQKVTSLEHNLRRSSSSHQRSQKEVQKALNSAKALRNQIKALEVKVEKQRKAISQTEEERNHYLQEATEHAKKVEMLLDEVRDAESLVFTYKKEMRDMETQLKQQQNLYAAVRNDRTGLARSLTESQDEISDLKGKLRVLEHQFDQLKEEIEAKEAALVKESQEQTKLAKEKDELISVVERVRANAKEMAATKLETERSHSMLKDRLRQTENDLDTARVQMEKALKERALLDNKISSIMNENSNLLKKLQVQERALSRGKSILVLFQHTFFGSCLFTI